MPNKYSILNDDEDDDDIEKVQVIDSTKIESKLTTESILNNRKKFPMEYITEKKEHIIDKDNITENKQPNDKKKLLFNNNWTANSKHSITYAAKVKEQIIDVPKSDIKKKSFTQQHVQRTEIIQLPDYYKTRLGEDKNVYEIPQGEYKWIKCVGALEKANSLKDMWSGIMSCAISYFENKEFLQSNKFFANKINSDFTFDESKQNEFIELICIQTTAILFHRLVKSDSVENVKCLLQNLPLYKVVSGNPVEMTHLSKSNGAHAYNRIKYQYMNDLRISQNKKGTYSLDEINISLKRIKDTEHRWINYILQSSWNGNNPIHDCLYYGACQSFECLLEQYFKLNMQNELNRMMLEPNIQEETHVDIVHNGKKKCEQHSNYIIRKGQFEKCEQLYNRTIYTLKNYSKFTSTFDDDEKSDASDGDTGTVHSLIINGDIEGMISHINRNKDDLNIVKKTLEIWQSTVDIDKTGQLIDYLDDVKFQTKEILDNVI